MQCCGSGMFIPDPTFFHPGSELSPFRIPDPGSASKNLSILTPSSRKYDPGCSSRIPDPGSGCWLSTHPGSRIQGSKRHRIPEIVTLHPVYFLHVVDPYVFGPPGSWYIIILFGGSSRKVRKTLISTILWLSFDFLSMKTDVNVPLKSTGTLISKKKIFNLSFIGPATDEKNRIQIRKSLDPDQNVTDLHSTTLQGTVHTCWI